ncbi:hypothetical protein, partial [Parvibacter caecicola]|uniref:hypothetical protein n=1 Tax=Parvibacter caecicola TaxID=747645 RepID=UPI00249B6B78
MTLEQIIKVIPKYRHHEIGYWNKRNSWVTLWKNETNIANSQFEKFLHKYGSTEVKVISPSPDDYVSFIITIERP